MNDNLPVKSGTPPAAGQATPGRPTAKPPTERSSAASGVSAPVGDIQVKKKSKTFNTYTLQLSMGQIEAIHSALEKDHANPIADELLQLFGYYLKTVPGPGEEEEDIKAQDEQDAIGNGEGEEEDDGLPIPMPPGYKGDGRTTVAGEGPEDDGGGAPGGMDDGGDGGGDGGGEGGGGMAHEPPTALPGADEMAEEDQRLPAPPRE